MSAFFSPRLIRVGACLLGSLLLGTAVAAAQTPPLAEVARREEERRKSLDPTKPPPKMLTNKDLPKVSAPSRTTEPPADPTSTGAAVEPAKVAPTTAADSADHDEAWWRARISAARESLRRDQVLLVALEARLNGLLAESARTGTYQPGRIGEDRKNVSAEMDRIRTEISDLTLKVADIEEEARKASVPPGWLR